MIDATIVRGVRRVASVGTAFDPQVISALVAGGGGTRDRGAARARSRHPSWDTPFAREQPIRPAMCNPTSRPGTGSTTENNAIEVSYVDVRWRTPVRTFPQPRPPESAPLSRRHRPRMTLLRGVRRPVKRTPIPGTPPQHDQRGRARRRAERGGRVGRRSGSAERRHHPHQPAAAHRSARLARPTMIGR